MSLFLSIVCFSLAILGAPIFSIIMLASIIGFSSSDIDLSVIPAELYRLAETPLLLSLPLFAFSGYILSEANTSQRLLRLSQSIFGWMPSGLAIMSLVCCALFTAFTGASGITIVALGGLLLPALIQQGYNQKFSLGLVTTTGSLGLLLPPSIPLILYGIIVQQMNLSQTFTLTELFLAGLVPGLLMIFSLALWIAWINRNEQQETEPLSLKKIHLSIRESIWELPLPLFILIGIFGGILAISEVAAVTALYVLIIEVFVYKEIKITQLPKIVSDSMQMVGGILLILGVSMAFTNYLIDAEIPNLMFNWISAHIDNKISFLLFLNIFLLLLGAILDIFSALIIVVPLIVPVALNYNVHPIHLGVVFLANMQIGYFTPPVGMNLFIASYRFKKPVTELYQASLPFMAILILCLIIITYVPWLSTWSSH